MRLIRRNFVTIAVMRQGVSPPTRSTIRSFGVVISPTETLRNAKPGHSFVVDDKRARNCVISTAHRLRIKVQTEKKPDGKYEIWIKST